MVSVLSMLHRGQCYIEASLFYRCKEIISVNTALMVSVPVSDHATTLLYDIDFFNHCCEIMLLLKGPLCQIIQPLYYTKSLFYQCYIKASCIDGLCSINATSRSMLHRGLFVLSMQRNRLCQYCIDGLCSCVRSCNHFII